MILYKGDLGFKVPSTGSEEKNLFWYKHLRSGNSVLSYVAVQVFQAALVEGIVLKLH